MGGAGKPAGGQGGGNYGGGRHNESSEGGGASRGDVRAVDRERGGFGGGGGYPRNDGGQKGPPGWKPRVVESSTGDPVRDAANQRDQRRGSYDENDNTRDSSRGGENVREGGKPAWGAPHRPSRDTSDDNHGDNHPPVPRRSAWGTGPASGPAKEGSR